MLPTIDIKGKEYVLVKDRVLFFNQTYPNGSITTERTLEGEMEVVKATVIPDCDKPQRMFTGYSQAKWGDGFINKTSALENAETSAVGRALAMMGIGVIDSIASADEMKKAEVAEEKKEVDDKPRFNKENLEKMIPYASTYKNADDAVKGIRTKYKLGKEMEGEVRKLYENIDVIKG